MELKHHKVANAKKVFKTIKAKQFIITAWNELKTTETVQQMQKVYEVSQLEHYWYLKRDTSSQQITPLIKFVFCFSHVQQKMFL